MDVSRDEASRYYLGHEKRRSSIGNGRQNDDFNAVAKGWTICLGILLALAHRLAFKAFSGMAWFWIYLRLLMVGCLKKTQKIVSLVLLWKARRISLLRLVTCCTCSLIPWSCSDSKAFRCPLPCCSSHSRRTAPPETRCQKLLVSHNTNFQYQSLRDFYDASPPFSPCACPNREHGHC